MTFWEEAIHGAPVRIKEKFAAMPDCLAAHAIYACIQMAIRAVHVARDHVPLPFCLQTLSVPGARFSGIRSRIDQVIWRYEWDSLPQFLPHHSAG